MANNQNNVQPRVVTTTTTTTSRRGRRRRRRTPRTSAFNKTTVRRVTTTGQSSRPRRRRRNRFGANGKQAPGGVRQRITATLGTVGANQGESIELEMSNLMNPALMKETTGSNQLGPLQIYASTYSLWKIDYLFLKLTPLVGASAVSGTAVRASFNLSGSPGSPSWSALGARKHKDTSPGRPMSFYLSGSDIKGPKDGWFYCNTKNDQTACIAGTLELHTLGKTVSTYTNKPFEGPLFLVELTAQWSFKNYNPQPGMMNLVKAELKEPEQKVKINSSPGQPITISVPEDSPLVRAIGGVDLNIAADSPPSEIIWQVCDTTMDVLSGTLPQPFGWLLRAGWWFVKRIANKKKSGEHVEGEADANEVTFQIYQSMQDAQNNVPCIATSAAASTNVTVSSWNITQITPGNVGQATNTGAPAGRSMPLTLDPISISSTPLFGQTAFYGHYHSADPHSSVAIKSSDGNAAVYTYSIWDLNKPSFLQNGQPIDPTQLQSQPYTIYAKENQTFVPIGRVYAAGYTQIGRGATSHHWTTVCWKATVSKTVTMHGTGSATDQFIFIQPTQSPQPNNFPATVYNATATPTYSIAGGYIRSKNIEEGNWYLSAFTAWQRAPTKTADFEYYGVPFYRSQAVMSPLTSSCNPDREAFEVGAVIQTTMSLLLRPPAPATTETLTTFELKQIRKFLAGATSPPFPLPPPPSEYDNLEIPPLEGEEEEPQGAVGGIEPSLDTRNWVEFGHRKRPPTPFSPIEEEEEEDEEESDLDDDDYAEPPQVIKNLLTPEAKDLYGDLRRKGLSHEQATKAAQAAFPHLALEAWEVAYHNAMADGLSPPTARDCAWSAVSDFLP